MIKAFFWSKKWALWAYGGGVIVLISLYLQVEMSVSLNLWRRGFYDLFQELGKHNLSEYHAGLWKFTYIAVPWVVLATLTNYFTRMYAFCWREAITFDYIPRWRNVATEVEGASQRIQEDTKRFANLVESLGLQVASALMTLAAFLPILWDLSKGIAIPFIGAVPGSLVWLALITTLGGLTISWFVGIKLPGLEYNNQKFEAAYRKELVYGEDDKKRFASVPTLTELFLGVKFNYRRLFLHYGYFDLWVNLYGQLMIIVPLIILGPPLFAGIITFGLLQQVRDAFDTVHGSFAVFVYNWTTVTELRSIWKRLHEFEANLSKNQLGKGE